MDFDFDSKEVEEHELMVQNMIKHNAYFEVHFNGRQKIQMVIDKINEKLEDNIDEDDNEIDICSLDFHYNFEPEEQIKVLDLLQNKHKCIEYKITSYGVPVCEVEPAHVEEMYWIEDEIYPMYKTKSRRIDEKAEKACRFRIIVLKNFKETTASLGTSNIIAYRLHRGKLGNEIYINDVLLRTVRDDSPGDKLLDYSFNNQGVFIEKRTFDGKDIVKILNDLKMTKTLWSLFFKIAKNGYLFHPEITHGELAMQKIDTKKVEQELKKLQA